LSVWVNAFFPLVGWQEDGYWANRPDLVSLLSPDFTVLPAEWLATPLNSDNEVARQAVAHLHSEEFAQMAYYQPTTLGELVFHQWE
jgi:hypothetical protein